MAQARDLRNDGDSTGKLSLFNTGVFWVYHPPYPRYTTKPIVSSLLISFNE